MKKHIKTSSMILTGVSMLMLSACLPQDEATLNEREAQQIESQIKQYAQSFQNYNSRSLNALISNPQFQSGNVAYGTINLSSAAFGSLNMGSAESYISSAYCPSSKGPTHITWLDRTDGDGDLSLKGLGKSLTGQAKAHLRSLASEENFGVYNGTDIVMGDGQNLDLNGACATINLPVGTVISAAYIVPANTVATPVEVRTILKSNECPVGQTGGITESITAEFYAHGDNKVAIGNSRYRDEADAIDRHAGGWTAVSNDCISETEAAILESGSMSSDIVNVSSLAGISANMQQTLADSLTNVECRMVGEKKSYDENDDYHQGSRGDYQNRSKKNNGDLEEKFNTCNEEISLDMLDNADISERTRLRATETIIENSCPSAPSSGTRNIVTSGTDYSTLPAAYRNSNATLTVGALNGNVRVTKLSETWEILTDLGNGIPSNPRGANDLCRPGVAECENIETHNHIGESIECSGENRLIFDCSASRPGLVLDPNATHSGPQFVRNTGISGWDDAEKLVANDYGYASSGWVRDTSAPESCSYVDNRVVSLACPAGYTGTYEETQERTGAGNASPSAPAWGAWVATASTIDTCAEEVVVATPPVGTPVATPPVGTPVATPPVGTPAATPPVATPPVGTPVATPVATPPVATPVATPPVATPPVAQPRILTSETRTQTIYSCPPFHSGTQRVEQKRTQYIVPPSTTPVWSDWFTTRVIFDLCRPNTGKGSTGNDPRRGGGGTTSFIDVDGDGKGDFATESEARRAGFTGNNGVQGSYDRVNNFGRSDGVQNVIDN